MATMTLGKLVEVDIRKLWNHEQYDFSEWLSKPENLEELNKVIGISLSEVEKEVFVGSYRCDLVGKDETTGDKVIIENQLEMSNHDHLGKIITYASGLDAKVVVWIVKEAREEHRSAIEWLNNNTSEKLNFFLIEIHAYQIGNSLCAPKFEIVEKPNDFIKNAKNQSGAGEYNKSQGERLEFWNRFNEILIDKGKPFNVRKASTDHWYDVAIGTSDAHITFTLVNKNGYIGVELTINKARNETLYGKLFSQKEEIEDKLGLKPEWQELEGKNCSRIIYKIPGLNFDDHSNYDELMNDMIDKGILFSKVFKKFV